MNLPIALSMPGWPETLFILVVVVLLFGAKKLPELARGLGQSLGEFKSMLSQPLTSSPIRSLLTSSLLTGSLISPPESRTRSAALAILLITT